MLSNKRLHAGLLLAGLIASSVQATFLPETIRRIPQAIRNIQVPESAREYAQRVMHLIDTHRGLALATGIGLVATPVALWAVRRLWRTQALPLQPNIENPTEGIGPQNNPEPSQVEAPTNFTGADHPFAQAGFIGSNGNDYTLNIPENIIVEQNTEQVAIGPELPRGEHSVTDSWVDLTEHHECTQLTPRGEINAGKILLICPMLDCIIDEERDLFKDYCKRLAAYLTHAYKKQIDVIFFTWDGDCCLNILFQNSADKLAQLVRQRSQGTDPRTISLWSIADSYNCKLINTLAEKLNQPINVGIHIGSLGTTSITTSHFDILFNFYSTADLGQAAQTWGNRKYQAGCARRLHNIRVQISGQDPESGIELRKALTPKNLIALMFDIDVHYSDYNDLDACCFLEEDLPYPLVTLRSQPEIIHAETIEYSDIRKARFKHIYNREIIYKGTPMQRLAVIGGQLARLVGRGAENVATQAWRAAQNQAGRGVQIVANEATQAYGAVRPQAGQFLTRATENVARLATTAGQELQGAAGRAAQDGIALLQYAGEAVPVLAGASAQWVSQQAVQAGRGAYNGVTNTLQAAGNGAVRVVGQMTQPRPATQQPPQEFETHEMGGNPQDDHGEAAAISTEEIQEDPVQPQPAQQHVDNTTQGWGQGLRNLFGSLRFW